VEYQKRKKVYHNDIVEFNGETLQVIINENLENVFNEEKIEQKIQTKSTARFIDKQEEDPTVASNNENAPKKNKRKPISF
jgi:ribosome-associated protein